MAFTQDFFTSRRNFDDGTTRIGDLDRKWVDLKRVDVAEALAYTGSVVGAVTNEVITSILTTPVAESEHAALRKLYFA